MREELQHFESSNWFTHGAQRRYQPPLIFNGMGNTITFRSHMGAADTKLENNMGV